MRRRCWSCNRQLIGSLYIYIYIYIFPFYASSCNGISQSTPTALFIMSVLPYHICIENDRIVQDQKEENVLPDLLSART